MFDRLHALRTSILSVIVAYALASLCLLAVDMLFPSAPYFSHEYWLMVLDEHIFPDMQTLARLLVVWGVFYLEWRFSDRRKLQPSIDKRKLYVTRLTDMQVDWKRLGIQLPEGQKERKRWFNFHLSE